MKICDQRLFHAENRIFGKVWAIRCEDVRHDTIEARRRHYEMEMGGTIGIVRRQNIWCNSRRILTVVQALLEFDPPAC